MINNIVNFLFDVNLLNSLSAARAIMTVWFYDLRTNMQSFGKTAPLTKETFAAFESAFAAVAIVQSVLDELKSYGLKNSAPPNNWQLTKLSEVCNLAQGEKLSEKIFPYLEVKYLRGVQSAKIIMQNLTKFLLPCVGY